ncbi:hypothetical protein [Flavobacterium sp.]|uniref:hypothetical protein n=1 Tax=Flavobacterium sp. TaxID=239 RepID=UPI0040331FC7
MGLINGYIPYEFPEGRDKAIIKLVDLYTRITPINDKFHFNDLGDDIRKNYHDFKEYTRELSGDARKKMEDLNYITKIGNLNYYQLTQIGQDVRLAGGHFSYVQKNNEQEMRKKTFEDTEHELNLSAIDANKYSKRTRWIAFISILISIIAVIYSIMDYYSTD